MYRILRTSILALLVVACTPTVEQAPPTGSPASNINVTYGDVQISLEKRAGWFAYPEANHLILAESANPMMAQGKLDGIVINIWAQPTSEQEAISAMLMRIVRQPDMQRTTATTMPRDFVWDGKRGAYYLLTSGDGNVTAVFVLEADARAQHVVGINISSPLEDLERLRQKLPVLLDGLTINDHQLAGVSLDSILAPMLVAPIYNPNPQAAMEASPDQVPTEDTTERRTP